MGTRPFVLTPQDVAAHLLRLQGPELFHAQTHVDLSSPIIPRPLKLNRPLWGLGFEWRGRVVIGVANYTAVASEAPQTIIERIRVSGSHRDHGNLTPWEIRGATAFAFARLFSQRGNSLYINATRQAEPSVPFQQVGATFGNIGTYDISAFYLLPMVPLGIPDAAAAGYMMHGADWGDTVQIQVFFGDKTSFGTPGGTTTVAFSAFGSGTGSPVVNISAIYGVLGPLRNAIKPAVVIRQFLPFAGEVQSTGVGLLLAQLQKKRTGRIILKAGTLLTGTSAGVNVFSDLSDNVLTRAFLAVDGKEIRNPNASRDTVEWAGRRAETVIPEGYQVFDFVDGKNPLTHYHGEQLDAGVPFELKSDVTGGANQAAEVIHEQYLGEPRAVAG